MWKDFGGGGGGGNDGEKSTPTLNNAFKFIT